MAVLATNLQEEEQIYLNSSQAQKIASGTILVVPDISANLLIRAFPNNQNFYYDQAGWPTAPALPGSVANAVNDVENNSQINAMKLTFGDSQCLRQRLHVVAGSNRLSWQPAALSGVERDPG